MASLQYKAQPQWKMGKKKIQAAVYMARVRYTKQIAYVTRFWCCGECTLKERPKWRHLPSSQVYVIFKRSTEVPFGFDQTMCCWLDNLLLHGVFPFYLPNSTYIHSFATVKVAILPFSEPWARVN